MRHLRVLPVVFWRSLRLALVLFLSLSLAHAQTTGTGTITGTLADRDSGRVAGAKVTVTESSTRLACSTATNGEGLYVLPALRIGSYDVLVESLNMAPRRQRNVVLDADTTRTVDVTIAVGGASETVTVNTAPPAVEGSSGALGGLISGTQVTELRTRSLHAST